MSNDGPIEQSACALLRKYEARKQTSVWIGAGLAGLIVLVTSDHGSDPLGNAPPLLSSVVLTLILIAGGALGMARANFEFAVRRINNRKVDGVITDEIAELPEDLRAPRKAEWLYRASLYTFFLAGLAYAVSVWWWLIV